MNIMSPGEVLEVRLRNHRIWKKNGTYTNSTIETCTPVSSSRPSVLMALDTTKVYMGVMAVARTALQKYGIGLLGIEYETLTP